MEAQGASGHCSDMPARRLGGFTTLKLRFFLKRGLYVAGNSGLPLHHLNPSLVGRARDKLCNPATLRQ